jgi:hypothetical protein
MNNIIIRKCAEKKSSNEVKMNLDLNEEIKLNWRR